MVSNTKEYMKAYRASKKAEQTKVDVAQTFEKVPTKFPGVFTLKPNDVNVIESDWHPSEVQTHDINESIFKSCGIPAKAVDGKFYVLVSSSMDANIDGEIEPFKAILLEDWYNGLERLCSHNLAGWSCKVC